MEGCKRCICFGACLRSVPILIGRIFTVLTMILAALVTLSVIYIPAKKQTVNLDLSKEAINTLDMLWNETLALPWKETLALRWKETLSDTLASTGSFLSGPICSETNEWATPLGLVGVGLLAFLAFCLLGRVFGQARKTMRAKN